MRPRRMARCILNTRLRHIRHAALLASDLVLRSNSTTLCWIVLGGCRSLGYDKVRSGNTKLIGLRLYSGRPVGFIHLSGCSIMVFVSQVGNGLSMPNSLGLVGLVVRRCQVVCVVLMLVR